MQQQEGLREHEKINHPGIPAYGLARKKNTGKQGKPVNWRPVNRDIDCIADHPLGGPMVASNGEWTRLSGPDCAAMRN